MTHPALVGRTAVVAGASRGIGLAIAEALHTAGAHVVRLARSLADDAGERRSDFRCDVTRPDEVRRVVEHVLEGRGAPDILVSNAGTYLLKDLPAITPEEFEAQIASTLFGAFVVLRAFLPGMLARRTGLIVTIGSVADHTPYPGNAAYAAAKFGVRGLHGVLTAELAGTGVRATLVSPGPVNTALWDPVEPDAQPGLTQRAAMLRSADVAEAVLFVATRPDHVVIPELRVVPRK